ENIKRIRVEADLSLRELAERLQENGHPIAHSGLSKIENRTRRVDADDLIAIAIALGVSPISLFLPRAVDPREDVQISGWGGEPAMSAWLWITGAGPLGGVEISAPETKPWWLRAETRYVLESVNPTSEAEEIRKRVEDGHGLDQAAP
ncbi:helix-turn-helix domain-containing protein, partial [Actinosynnema sp.]|uniref:helix-turn-helix domain-containing protein n=1 Tax=Actinosynnema sp. TaxID=1872144 RepID=UPI003F86E897